jgi:hypothetical protein
MLDDEELTPLLIELEEVASAELDETNNAGAEDLGGSDLPASPSPPLPPQAVTSVSRKISNSRFIGCLISIMVGYTLSTVEQQGIIAQSQRVRKIAHFC